MKRVHERQQILPLGTFFRHKKVFKTAVYTLQLFYDKPYFYSLNVTMSSDVQTNICTCSKLACKEIQSLPEVLLQFHVRWKNGAPCGVSIFLLYGH